MIPRDGEGVAISLVRAMLTGSAIGVVVRNNTDDPAEATISVAYKSLGGWCEVADPDEEEAVEQKPAKEKKSKKATK